MKKSSPQHKKGSQQNKTVLVGRRSLVVLVLLEKSCHSSHRQVIPNQIRGVTQLTILQFVNKAFQLMIAGEQKRVSKPGPKPRKSRWSKKSRLDKAFEREAERRETLLTLDEGKQAEKDK